MATICPKCWNLGDRTQMECVSSGRVEEVTPVDMFPDGTEIRHPKIKVTSVYGTCTCPKCGHKEETRDPREDHKSTKK